ncbi:DUF1508 domain-containing protein [Flavobacterium sp. NST-5]|uniref:DUF1508 domain-containing protein n=1 Tax=Flavobacterium ichthyis TaxID=2698827 RepID=A0ABW9Z754_9FLAO|nr:DUF1508 domain-containing protein [Flavobacterium ichthyis]NBL63664.1 DUF1508 domain-containing protein [Flavobacterium ichthyis]
MGAFVITQKDEDHYKFTYNSRKGKIIFTSATYELKMDIEADIEIIQQNAENAFCMKFKTSSGKFFYRLIIHDKVYATSRKFNTALRLEKGINEVRLYVPKAEILDFTGADIFAD